MGLLCRTRTARLSGHPACGFVVRPPYAAPVRHAMLGVGGVGGLVGAVLARAGEDVTLLMRAESLQTYAGTMRVESVVLGDFQVEVAAAAALADTVDVLW